MEDDGMMPRDEHLAWCKRRALEYLDAGDLQNAAASMGSDLGKHPELGANDHLMMLGMMCAMQHDAAGMRRWIEGFR
jgi:hypothetical protein